MSAKDPSYQFFWWPRLLPRILVRALLSFSIALIVVILVGLAMLGNFECALRHAAVALMLTPIGGLMWFCARQVFETVSSMFSVCAARGFLVWSSPCFPTLAIQNSSYAHHLNRHRYFLIDTRKIT